MIGGNSNITSGASILNPWENAIGVFDLSAMEWKDGYDAEAAPYVTPNDVKTYLNKNGREPASWSNDVVKGWFTNTTTTAPKAESPTSANMKAGSPTSGNKKGAIAGGAVGGVVGFTLVALIAGVFLDTQNPIPELIATENGRIEMETQEVASELPYHEPSEFMTSEMPHYQRYEM